MESYIQQVQIKEIKESSVQLYIDFMDTQNRIVGAHITENSATGEYVTLNIRESIPGTATTARVYIILRSKSAGAMGNVVVDNARFEYVTK
ncbi:hypothetical protein [Paenibacillus sp. NPDC057934]|uniref:hypothetical protein n=1 Tax=Paenibacillus sp. NPDC057934 TaxID=3346282 RepID=UPI0036DF0FCC